MHNQIETVYRCRIYYEMHDADGARYHNFLEKVTDFAHYRLGKRIEVESFSGNPAYGPQILLESEDHACLAKAAMRLESYIMRWRGAVLE